MSGISFQEDQLKVRGRGRRLRASVVFKAIQIPESLGAEVELPISGASGLSEENFKAGAFPKLIGTFQAVLIPAPHLQGICELLVRIVQMELDLEPLIEKA